MKIVKKEPAKQEKSENAEIPENGSVERKDMQIWIYKNKTR